jgi:hypothetical protein
MVASVPIVGSCSPRENQREIVPARNFGPSGNQSAKNGIPSDRNSSRKNLVRGREFAGKTFAGWLEKNAKWPCSGVSSWFS